MSVIAGRVVKQALKSLRPVFHSPEECLIIPPADSGSVGDQAMTEAVCATVTGGLSRRASILHFRYINEAIRLRAPARYLTPVAASTDGAVRRLRSSRLFNAYRCGAIGVVGADVFDGVYGPDTTLRKLDLLASAHDAGARTAVFGCSISETPAQAVLDRLRAMPWLTVHLRDPVSQARFERLTGRSAPLVADVAFLLEPAIVSEQARALMGWIEERRAAGGQILGFNLSGHTLHKAPEGALEAHIEAVRRWMAAAPDRAILLTPHDTRPSPIGDIEPAEQALETLRAVDPDRVRLHHPPIDAWEVKALAGALDGIMTGRMHYAIAAMGTGTPALCVTYQGKYEGLMALFEIDGMLIDPGALTDVTGLTARVETFAAAAQDTRRRIAERLPAVRTMAQANFDWLR